MENNVLSEIIFPELPKMVFDERFGITGNPETILCVMADIRASIFQNSDGKVVGGVAVEFEEYLDRDTPIKANGTVRQRGVGDLPGYMYLKKSENVNSFYPKFDIVTNGVNFSNWEEYKFLREMYERLENINDLLAVQIRIAVDKVEDLLSSIRQKQINLDLKIKKNVPQNKVNKYYIVD